MPEQHVTTSDILARLVIPHGTPLFYELQNLAKQQRMVFFAGLPGTGKSLLMHQLAHLAAVSGRTIHLLQWDVVRPEFETHPAGQRYPVVQGVTHGIIRKAIGLWVRWALAQWRQRYPESHHLLIGETPFVGHRFIELARSQDDPAEEFLKAGASLFVIPVPSRQVRRFVETARQRRSTNPLHEQEREDAPPQVLQALWHELIRVAPFLGIPTTTRAAHVPYDPGIYQRAYQALLKHRHTQVLALDMLLPTDTMSVYDFAIARTNLIPTPDEVVRFLRQAEQGYPDSKALRRDLDQWYLV
jgi:hypothetical protein